LWTDTPVWLVVSLSVLELLSWWGGWWVDAAGIPLSPVAAVGLPVALWVSRRSWRSSTTVVSLCLLVTVSGTAVGVVGLGRIAALLASAGAEETVFRLALPAVVVLGCARRKVPPPVALVAAVSVTTVLFTVMPGHVAQWGGSMWGPLPWAAMSLLWCWMLWRGAALVACVAVHAAMNVAASVVIEGGPQWMWTVTVAVGIAGLVASEAWRDSRRAARGVLAAP